MQQIGTFFKKATDIIANKTQQTLQEFQQNIANIENQSTNGQKDTSIVPDFIGNQAVSTPTKQLTQNQKVLQIDIIESGFIPKTQQALPQKTQRSQQGQLHQKTQNQIVNSEVHDQVSRLKHVEQQKRSILEELKKLDEEIAEIKGEQVQDGALKRRQKQQENEEAAKQAKNLVKQLKAQKKEIEERKRKQAQKSYQLMKQQEEERKTRQAEEIERAKEERRRKIEVRMEEDRKKRQERKLIEKESNRLLKQLKKEETVLKQKEELPQQTGEIEQKKKVVEKKQDVNFRQIEEHQRRYIQMKEQERSIKKNRAESVNHHAPQYKKNMWLEQIQEQEQKRKEQEQIRQASRKGQLEKRKKYGDLVKNIFVPKQQKKPTQTEVKQKPSTPDVNLLPRIPQSEKRITDSKPMKKFIDQNRPFATAHNPKPPRPSKKDEKSPEDLEREKQKKVKQLQMRKQTRQRLKKLENKSLQALPQSLSKPKYENYLGKVKVKAEEGANSWKKVIDNEKISKEDKYKQMLRRAAAMENKAKVKQEVMRDGDDEAVNLYIGSIQAKLAILEKF